MLITGVGLAMLVTGSACVPSKPLGEYAREEPGAAGGAGTAGAGGSAGSAGTAGSAGRGGNAAQAGQPSLPEPSGDDAGAVSDAGDAGDAGPLLPDAGRCAAGELLGPEQRCYFFDATVATWAAARGACQARGTDWDLVRVRTAEQSAFLGDQLAFEAWIGATDAASEGQWVWVGDISPFWVGNGATGAPSGGSYTNWGATEPNGATLTNCARALPRSAGNANPDAPWADLDCAVALGAVCESGPLP